MLRGNPSKKSLAALTDDFQPEVVMPSCPSHLLPEARKEWNRMRPFLLRNGLVSDGDRAALALYVQSWARWVWAEKQLQRAQAQAQARMDEAEAKGLSYEGGDGITIPTPNGHMTYSPHWVIANKSMEQVHKFLASFGLDPSSRGRVSPSKIQQRDMFDDDEAQGGFNDL
jgi:P27 family predicted phage terminase small subunit